jgi:hypothetical protein
LPEETLVIDSRYRYLNHTDYYSDLFSIYNSRICDSDSGSDYWQEASAASGMTGSLHQWRIYWSPTPFIPLCLLSQRDHGPEEVMISGSGV